jgi:MFS family permease
MKLSPNTRLLVSIFIPLYVIHCVEQVYFTYGNVLQKYGLTPETTGLVLGSFFIAIMLMRPVGGWLLENLGIRRTMFVGSVVGFAGCSILFGSHSVPMLFAGRVLSGAAFGIYTMGLFSYQSLEVPEDARGMSFALTVSGGILPAATVTPIGEWLITNGWMKSYLAIGPILCVVCFMLGRKMKSASEGAAKKTWGKYRDLVFIRPFVMVALTGTMMALIDAATVSISLLALKHGLVTSYFMASYSVAALIVRLGGARVLNILPRSFCIAPCGMMMAGAIGAITYAPSNGAFLIWGALFGVGIGAGFPMLLASVSDALPPELMPKGAACALLLYDAGWAITPLIVGYMTPELGLERSFMALALVVFVAMSALMVFYWLPERHRRARAR